MNDIETIESQLNSLNDLIAKTTALINDSKICSSDITKSLIASAVKKYANAISEFKLETGE